MATSHAGMGKTSISVLAIIRNVFAVVALLAAGGTVGKRVDAEWFSVGDDAAAAVTVTSLKDHADRMRALKKLDVVL